MDQEEQHDKQGENRLSRREVLHMAAAVGGTLALSTVLEACQRAAGLPVAAATPTPTCACAAYASPTPGAGQNAPPTSEPPATSTPTGETTPSPTQAEAGQAVRGRVAFVKTSDRVRGVEQAIELLGANPVDGKDVFLKPNFNSADPTPGSTHPDVLAALVRRLQGMGALAITVADRSGMGDTRQVMKKLGVFDLAEQLGFVTLVLDELASDEWERVSPPGSHWQQGYLFPRACRQAGAVVQTCCLKTHRYGGHFTLSLKNSVGLAAKRVQGDSYNYMTELHNSPHQRRMIAEINTAYQPALVVLDGVEAFISGGPDNGERVASQVMLASADRVALDAVGVALLRYHGCTTEAARGKIFEQEQIARAVELGLGARSPQEIELLTGDADSAGYAQEIRGILDRG